jgi:hypothetical protein
MINQVLTKLKEEGYQPSLTEHKEYGFEWKTINWNDELNGECFIYQDNIAIENNRLAWFQSSNRDNHLLKIYYHDYSFSWVPETYNPFFGCTCLLLEWYKDHLLFIYQEKHEIYICSIFEKHVNYFHFHGEEIERNGDLISYETYMNKTPEAIKLIQIPELIQLKPITREEAEKLNLVPTGLNRPGNFLALK